MDRARLIEMYGPLAEVTNETVIQLCKDTAKLPSITAANWLLLWRNETVDVSPDILRSKMSRVAKKGAKLRGGALESFKREPFTFPRVSTPSTSSVQPTPSPPSLISSSTTAPSLPLKQPHPYHLQQSRLYHLQQPHPYHLQQPIAIGQVQVGLR